MKGVWGVICSGTGGQRTSLPDKVGPLRPHCARTRLTPSSPPPSPIPLVLVPRGALAQSRMMDLERRRSSLPAGVKSLLDKIQVWTAQTR